MTHFKTWLAVLLLALVGTAQAGATFIGDRSDFRDESIYFVITTRFYDGDNTNNTYCWDGSGDAANQDPEWRGDFKGLIEKLDYIKAMGFTAIWVTPIVQNGSGFDYHGYHAMDFSQVDKRYESQDVSFQTLVDAVHAKGMKIILDIVINHTGNFGEGNLCKLFTRDYSAEQSNINACMVPYTMKQGGKLNDNYLNLPAGEQYADRLTKMKNTDGVNHDTHNLWHHYGQFNWDESNRWWAQIAGDCVDLNTENPQTYNYLIDCYGKFIAMGVDGFRIDTGGHISRLTFNAAFLPKFKELGEKYKSKRLNQAPFFMFAEVCARYSSICYRDQPALSPFFYTWASDPSLVSQWNSDGNAWNNLEIYESTDPATLPNQSLCLKEEAANTAMSSQPTSNNALLDGNTYHQPDHTKASGMGVIDFTAHWNFQNAGRVLGIMDASNDKYYNDATYNVVYVESHDYGPDSFNRFDGGTSQWAENMDVMFTMRGIPCLYYGGEIEFRKGYVMDKGTIEPLKNTGRAYYGGYIKGDVEAGDFGEVKSASGNVAATLSKPLVKHLQRLNKIRQAVPALRKGQYSKQGCAATSGYAFKRRYTSGTTDSYVLVTINSGATFTGVLNGTYTDCITGDQITVTNGTLTTPAFSGKGNMRVYVLNGPGKIGSDGPFLYASSPVTGTELSYDGTQEEGDPTTKYVGATGGSGSGDGGDVSLDSVPVYTPAIEAGELSVFAEVPATQTACTVWAWNASENFTGGSWPGQAAQLMGKTADGTRLIYKWTYSGSWNASHMPTGLIFSQNGNSQTADLEFKNHGYYIDGKWDHEVTNVEAGVPTVTASIDEGTYSKAFDVTLTASDPAATIVYTTNGTVPSATNGTQATGKATVHIGSTTTLMAGVLVNGKARNVISREYVVSDFQPRTATVYVKDPTAAPWNWTAVHYWAWDANGNLNTNQTWPGDAMTQSKVVKGDKFLYATFQVPTEDYLFNFIFSQNGNPQTVDLGPYNKDVYLQLDSQNGGRWTVKDVTSQYATAGDLNGDGKVNASDVTVLVNAIIGGSTGGNHDIDGNGVVNTSDVTSLVTLVLAN